MDKDELVREIFEDSLSFLVELQAVQPIIESYNRRRAVNDPPVYTDALLFHIQHRVEERGKSIAVVLVLQHIEGRYTASAFRVRLTDPRDEGVIQLSGLIRLSEYQIEEIERVAFSRPINTNGSEDELNALNP